MGKKTRQKEIRLGTKRRGNYEKSLTIKYRNKRELQEAFRIKMANGNGQKKCEGCGTDISSGKLCKECEEKLKKLLEDL